MASGTALGESSSGKSQWKYDVFLSFRGEDTRKNFTDHLYAAFHRKGIVIYRDDPNLEKGKNISNQLLQAIENSRYLIVIMSRDYASSTWCLEELAKIVECMKGGEQMAIPIFYKVDPSNVRKQKGSFESAFAQHEVTFKDDLDKVQRWKNALTEISNLAGWDLLDRPESQFIQDIVEDLQNKLGKTLSYAPKNLVGMKYRLEDMFQHLSLRPDDVRFIGISGMGGIGKSTLARAIFDEISARFEACSFLANIREASNTMGLVHVQNKLLLDTLQEKDLITDVIAGADMIGKRLKHKRALVVLDDVDHIDHLKYLANKSWFGCGSRIIITTRDEHLLRIHCVDVVYKAKELSNEEALELFCSNALGENNRTIEFTILSKEVTEYAKGLPLALIVLGSFLYGRSISEWQSALARLRESPNKQIFETLRLSFDGLEEKEKAIFLDVACFFNGNNKDYVMRILDSCGFYPEIGVNVLIERSLLTVINNEFIVHDLLQEMAWEIVRQESPKEPGKRSRLWLYADINHVMKGNTGTERIEGIVSRFYKPKPEKIVWNAGCFRKMTNLRLLVIGGAYFNQIKYLPNTLMWLTSYHFPSRYLPANFLPESLHELHLCYSNLKRLWRGQKVFEKLKHIDLRGSKYLEELPDFRTIPNLEKLNLCSCNKLSQIHPSIGVLYNLKFLDLSLCKKLRKLPPSIGGLRSLQVLDLRWCSNLKELPDSICSLECLEELDISYTNIAHLPPNLGNLNNLKRLCCEGRKGMRPGLWSLLFPKARGMFLPSLSGLSSLEQLDLRNCHLQEGSIPNDLGCLPSLRKLNLSFNDFLTIPESINGIPSLEALDLTDCKKLQALPRLPESIFNVEVKNCVKLNSISNLFVIFTDGGSDCCLINCSKFLPVDLDIPLVQKYSLALLCYIIGASIFRRRFGKTYVVAPYYEFPKWFTYQKDGSFLSFSMRDVWFRKEVGGFAICASFLRQEQEYSNPKHPECSSFLICEFNVNGNQLGPDIYFPIRFITSSCLWMGFVSLGLFKLYIKLEEIIDERIDVSLRTTDDQLKVIKCGILPLRYHESPQNLENLIELARASSSPEDTYVSSIFHELVYQEVNYHFSSGGDNEARKDHLHFPRNRRRSNKSAWEKFFDSNAHEEAMNACRLWYQQLKRELTVEPHRITWIGRH